MYPESDSNDALTLRDYVRVLRLRKWLVLAVALLLPLAAVLYSLQQERVYQAEADVLISRENVGASLAGAGETLERGDPDRLIGTQAAIASSPIVGERVLEAMGLTDRTPQEFLAAAKVTQKPNTDILEFRVTDPDAALAARLATEYARQFTMYRQELDTAALQRAREGLEAQIAALEKSRRPNPALYADLVSKNQQLRTLEAL